MLTWGMGGWVAWGVGSERGNKAREHLGMMGKHVILIVAMVPFGINICHIAHVKYPVYGMSSIPR